MTDWQPIDTAPFDIPILVFGYWRPTWTAPEPRMAVWERDSRDRDRGEGLQFYSRVIGGTPTHWMPLPEAPASGILTEGGDTK